MQSMQGVSPSTSKFTCYLQVKFHTQIENMVYSIFINSNLLQLLSQISTNLHFIHVLKCFVIYLQSDSFVIIFPPLKNSLTFHLTTLVSVKKQNFTNFFKIVIN